MYIIRIKNGFMIKYVKLMLNQIKVNFNFKTILFKSNIFDIVRVLFTKLSNIET